MAPPLPLVVLALLSLFGCVLTAGFAYRYTVMWERERAGKSIEEQRLTMDELPIFRRDFVAVVEQIRAVLPPGTRLFLEPTRIAARDNQHARWFLFLTYWAHPVQIYVRKPHWAAGTLIDYPKWNQYHRILPRIQVAEGYALSELGIEWKLRMPIEWSFFSNEIYLERLVDGDWVKWDLWTNRPLEQE